MGDNMEKIDKLSKIIVNYSLEINKDDKVLITYQNQACNDLVVGIIREIKNIGATVNVKLIDPIINHELLLATTENRAKLIGNYSEFEVENYTTFIQIRYNINDYEDNDISSDIRNSISKYTRKFDEVRINERKWVLLNYPSPLDAYKAHQSIDKFKNYALDSMITDYNDLYERMRPLKTLMEKTNIVKIIGPSTNISFSIKNMPVIPCCGKSNLPDGELFTAPIKTSVNGKITYNTPSPYRGSIFNNVSLEFKDGKIINMTCDGNNELLTEIFNTDEGSKYIGEFSLGLNPNIKNSIGNILFDEKIKGSIHFTPGQAYYEADNGNRSDIHWDLVLIQRPEYGGGEIYFDDVLIRKDGEFVVSELKHLNYNS